MIEALPFWTGRTPPCSNTQPGCVVRQPLWWVVVIGSLGCSPTKLAAPPGASAPGPSPPSRTGAASVPPPGLPSAVAERGSNGPEAGNQPDPEPWEDGVKYPENPHACMDLAGNGCHWLCVRYEATLLPAPAERGIACLRKAAKADADACLDPCTGATCTAAAFAEVKGRGDARCQTLRKPAEEGAFEMSYAAAIAEGCEAYTGGMNRVGRDRFLECIRARMFMGFRSCLWDATVAPCGHGKEGDDIDLE